MTKFLITNFGVNGGSMKKFIIIILSILLATIIGFDIYLVYRHYNQVEPPHLDVIPYEHFYMPQEHIETQYTKLEIKEMIDCIYNVDYKYQEVGFLNSNVLGKSNIDKKVLKIVPYINEIEYIWVLSHELVHIKYQTANETFTEYTSIITLYESNNILFQKVALNRAKFIISGAYQGTEYDCGYYLLEYFNWSKND